ncbi:unnamed protein product [Prunus brigantina]
MPSITLFKRDSNPESHLRHFKSAIILYKVDDALMYKEYTSYRTIRRHVDHLFNLHKKANKSHRDYLRRFKAEKANIIGCNDLIAASVFKKGLPTEHELLRKRYALWDDDRISTKKASKQADHPTRHASQKSNKRPPPLREDPSGRDTSKYYTFHGEHGHYTNNCNAWKRHLEELLRDDHYTKFIAKKAI